MIARILALDAAPLIPYTARLCVLEPANVASMINLYFVNILRNALSMQHLGCAWDLSCSLFICRLSICHDLRLLWACGTRRQSLTKLSSQVVSPFSRILYPMQTLCLPWHEVKNAALAVLS